MNFKNDFQKREFIARQALLELKYQHPKLFKYQLFFTLGEYDEYDAYFFVQDINGSIKKRVWIELKIRDHIYPNYLLEKKKLMSLRKLRDKNYLLPDEVIFLYINFTPGNTIIWNITDIDSKRPDKIIANKSTSKNRFEKVSKDVFFLWPEDGKVLDYILDEDKIIRKYEDKQEKKKSKIPKKGIFG